MFADTVIPLTAQSGISHPIRQTDKDRAALIGQEIPQDLPGTNPQDMLSSPLLRPIR